MRARRMNLVAAGLALLFAALAGPALAQNHMAAELVRKAPPSRASR